MKNDGLYLLVIVVVLFGLWTVDCVLELNVFPAHIMTPDWERP